MGRRDTNDNRWKEVREEVFKRDKGDRILKVLSLQEFYQLKRNAGSYLRILDPAHYLEVSKRPDLCYEVNNIVTLNRYSHSNLDSFHHPITGEHISKEEVQKWWDRILRGNKAQYEFLKSEELI